MRPAFEAAKAVCNGQRAIGVEVGVAFGVNALDVLSGWPGLTLNLVDNYSEEPRREAGMRELVAGRGANIVIKDSVEAAKDFAGQLFDIVYLDADHTYEGVKADLEAWYPLVKKGGVFGGDDYENTLVPGVKRAVQEFAAKYKLELHTAPNYCGGDWFVYA